MCNGVLIVAAVSCVSRDFRVRLAYEADTAAITNLVSELCLHETLLEDLAAFHQYRRDPVRIGYFIDERSRSCSFWTGDNETNESTSLEGSQSDVMN